MCKVTEEVTTKEKSRKSFEKKFDLIGFQKLAVGTLRKTYDKTQTTIISLPVKEAFKLLVTGKSKNRLCYVSS